MSKPVPLLGSAVLWWPPIIISIVVAPLGFVFGASWRLTPQTVFDEEEPSKLSLCFSETFVRQTQWSYSTSVISGAVNAIGFIGCIIYYIVWLKKYHNWQGKLSTSQSRSSQVIIPIKLALCFVVSFSWMNTRVFLSSTRAVDETYPPYLVISDISHNLAWVGAMYWAITDSSLHWSLLSTWNGVAACLTHCSSGYIGHFICATTFSSSSSSMKPNWTTSEDSKTPSSSDLHSTLPSSF